MNEVQKLIPADRTLSIAVPSKVRVYTEREGVSCTDSCRVTTLIVNTGSTAAETCPTTNGTTLEKDKGIVLQTVHVL